MTMPTRVLNAVTRITHHTLLRRISKLSCWLNNFLKLLRPTHVFGGSPLKNEYQIVFSAG